MNTTHIGAFMVIETQGEYMEKQKYCPFDNDHPVDPGDKYCSECGSMLLIEPAKSPAETLLIHDYLKNINNRMTCIGHDKNKHYLISNIQNYPTQHIDAETTICAELLSVDDLRNDLKKFNDTHRHDIILAEHVFGTITCKVCIGVLLY